MRYEDIDLSSFRFGAGRYLQGCGMLANLAEECARFGSKPLIIAGPHALAATRDVWQPGFVDAGMSFELQEYSGFPSFREAERQRGIARDHGCDLIVGIGGGKILDLAKKAAEAPHLPVVTVPTSCATCAAFTPLSVMYTDEGACLGYEHFEYELSAVLVDTEVMAKQPARLMAAGTMDAMAKAIEISNGKPAMSLETDPLDKYAAFVLAQFVYDQLESFGKQAYDDVAAGSLTKTVEDAVFLNIALTGVVSGMMRARGQTAVAHRLYEIIRTYYFREAAGYLHGEIVAAGLLCQLAYNGDAAGAERLRAFMRTMAMPQSLPEMNVPSTPRDLDFICDKVCGTDSVPDDPEHRARLRACLEVIA